MNPRVGNNADPSSEESEDDELNIAGTHAGWLEPPQPQDLVLTLLADNVRNRLDKVWSGGLVRLLSEFGFTTGAARVALARLVRRDLIARSKEGRVVYYELTERTERLLKEGDRRIFTLGQDDCDDDGITVLIHTLHEEHRLERARLARRLRFLRFSPLQDSIWISAGNRQDDVLPLLVELNVAEYCSLVIGRMSADTRLQSLVERAWDLPALGKRYEEFVSLFGKYDGADVVDDATAFRTRTQLMHNFRQFPSLDPGVGKTLWPHPKSRAVAIDIFGRTYRDLAEPAHRHFDDVTSVVKAGVR